MCMPCMLHAQACSLGQAWNVICASSISFSVDSWTPVLKEQPNRALDCTFKCKTMGCGNATFKSHFNWHNLVYTVNMVILSVSVSSNGFTFRHQLVSQYLEKTDPPFQANGGKATRHNIPVCFDHSVCVVNLWWTINPFWLTRRAMSVFKCDL